MFKRWVQGALTALAAVVLCATTPVASHADLFELTADFCTGGCGTMPAGTVTVLQNGANVDVTVHLLQGNSFVKTGASGFTSFMFNGTGVALGDITVDAHIPVLAAASGAFGNPGTVGDFTFGISCPTCANGSSGAFSNDIVFHVANATIADLTAPNADGFIFAADILSAQTLNTGIVGTPGPVVGAGIPGLIAGCALLIGLARRRRKLA